MSLLGVKLKTARDALKTLEQVLGEPFSAIARDAAIQRFEYTVEALWKCLQLYLREKEGIERYSPKSCFREAGKIGLLVEQDVITALEMIDDRNLTAHTYHQEVAEKIFKKLPSYARVMKALLGKMETG